MSIGTGWVEGSWTNVAWIFEAWEGGVATAVLTASLSDGVLETELRRSWQDLNITLHGDSWATGITFNDSRQDLIDGTTSAGVETSGWNNEVRDKLSVVSVTRVVDSISAIAFRTFSGYAVDSNETITVTVPASILAGSTAITATPTFSVTAVTEGASAIVNAESTSDVPTNYEQCDRSGFKQYPDDLVRNWDGVYTRRKSYDERHPQLLIRSVSENLKGSPSPEGDDVFVGTNEVKAEDL